MSETKPAPVPPVQLVQRSAGGIAGYLFQQLDDIAAGKPIDMARINATVKVAAAFNGLVRSAIALEKHRLTGAEGLVVDHVQKPNGAAADSSESTG